MALRTIMTLKIRTLNIFTLLLLLPCITCLSCTGEIRQLHNDITALNRTVSELNNEVFRIRTELENQRKNDFTILCGGDILLAEGADAAMREHGSNYPFMKIHNEIRKYDIFFANLESPITDRGTPFTDKPYTFRLSHEFADSLCVLGVNVLSLANNHIMDYGKPGLEDTIACLDKLDIRHAGAGNNLTRARRPAILRRGNTDLLFLAFCGRPPVEFYADMENPGTSPMHTENIIRDIQKYKTGKNILIVSLHWGIEQRSTPRRYQVRLAHMIIDAGADCIIGHHPHWPQAVEIYRNRPIFYSLGNFVNGFCNKIEKDNILAVLHYSENVLGKIEILALAGKNRDMSFQPYVQTGKEAARTLGEIAMLSARFSTTIEIRGHRGIINMKN